MFATNKIQKKASQKLKKIVDETHSTVAENLEDIYKNSVGNYKELMNAEVKDLKKYKNQLKIDIKEVENTKKNRKQLKEMKKLKKKIAGKIETYESYIGGYEYKKKLKKRSQIIINHSLCVLSIANEINEIIAEPLDSKLIECVSIMHDSYKLVDKSYRHSSNSAYLFNELHGEKFFSKIGDNDAKIIVKAINLHNKPEKIYAGTEYSQEEILASILHDADKISKLYKKKNWMKKKTYLSPKDYEKNIDKIRKKLRLLESEKIIEKHVESLIERKLYYV
ncbi:HD domain-containing protein [Fusibacter sp. 3D3]|uniref:HD domain-containing protein n=1 Tax=Fusibacter sp. 3D3 TaxID=1048380 RepID=UPI000852F675|nr:HD domain-containing protein [Fusibacter sp. 3D3]GAU79587.1 hypothetical protein F3D3_4251 [Fusibacter sp. 3D3]